MLSSLRRQNPGKLLLADCKNHWDHSKSSRGKYSGSLEFCTFLPEEARLEGHGGLRLLLSVIRALRWRRLLEGRKRAHLMKVGHVVSMGLWD